jgi:hypothetical protein
MHPLRFIWERVERARRATKSEPDLLRLAEASIMRRFVLARIDEAAATSAFKQFTGSIKHRCPALAVTTHEPSPPPAKAASCPANWHALFDRPPIVAAPPERPAHARLAAARGSAADPPGPRAAAALFRAAHHLSVGVHDGLAAAKARGVKLGGYRHDGSISKAEVLDRAEALRSTFDELHDLATAAKNASRSDGSSGRAAR